MYTIWGQSPRVICLRLDSCFVSFFNERIGYLTAGDFLGLFVSCNETVILEK